jgi:hypothetical protein
MVNNAFRFSAVVGFILAASCGAPSAQSTPSSEQKLPLGLDCVIAGHLFLPGAVDPFNPCLVCNPLVDRFHFSVAANGASCGVNRICETGVCIAVPNGACVIGGNVFGPGAANPANECQICWPASSPTTWSNSLDGKPCLGGAGQCIAGACQGLGSCRIMGVNYTDGDWNPQNPCQVCDAAKSFKDWSNAADGAACGSSDEACFGGQCVPTATAKCTIQGTVYNANAVSPSNPCAWCQPRQSEVTWTNAPDGSNCGGGKQCFAGVCE